MLKGGEHKAHVQGTALLRKDKDMGDNVKIELCLDEKDTRALLDKALGAGLTIPQFLESFVSDLIDSEKSIGSSGKKLVQEWYEQRKRDPGLTMSRFLAYGGGYHDLDYVAHLATDIQGTNRHLEALNYRVDGYRRQLEHEVLSDEKRKEVQDALDTYMGYVASSSDHLSRIVDEFNEEYRHYEDAVEYPQRYDDAKAELKEIYEQIMKVKFNDHLKI